MRQHHQARRAVALAVLCATAALIAPAQSAEAQGHGGQCLQEYTVETRVRRITGSVMVECGDECLLPPPYPCHSPPWGNWGVTTPGYETKKNADQFKGWRRFPGLYDNLSQWNSCTDQYYDGEFVNDGRGRQKASPDDEEAAAYKPVRSPLACAGSLPEVYTVRNLRLHLYELDWDGADCVTTLKYGFFSFPITCSDAWTCYGDSGWRTQLRVDSTGVTADVRVKVESKFVSY